MAELGEGVYPAVDLDKLNYSISGFFIHDFINQQLPIFTGLYLATKLFIEADLN